jgi:hypothetical protein
MYCHIKRIPESAKDKKTGGATHLISAVKSRIRFFLSNQAGEGFIDVLVKMLIVVVVGAVLLAIMRQAIPQLFNDMLTKIRDVFEV